jgi:hypothetical protein
MMRLLSVEYLYHRYACLGAIASMLYPNMAANSLQRLQPHEQTSRESNSCDRMCCWVSRPATKVAPSHVIPTTVAVQGPVHGTVPVKNPNVLSRLPIFGRFLSNRTNNYSVEDSSRPNMGHLAANTMVGAYRVDSADLQVELQDHPDKPELNDSMIVAVNSTSGPDIHGRNQSHYAARSAYELVFCDYNDREDPKRNLRVSTTDSLHGTNSSPVDVPVQLTTMKFTDSNDANSSGAKFSDMRPENAPIIAANMTPGDME